MSRYVLTSALLLLGSSTVAVASDGVLEINQTCAANGGCFSGDAALFPVTISASGSYVLTSNLTVADANLDAIEITADGVSIELNGFELAGPVTCMNLGSDVTCGAGSGIGIDAVGRTRTRISHGLVRGFGSGGIAVGERAHIEDVIADSNGATGILTGSGSTVHSATAYRNGQNGIEVGGASLVHGSKASSNFSNGILGQNGSIVGNLANDNGGDGINGGFTVRDNTLQANEGDGIDTLTGTVSFNMAISNLGDGIKTAGASAVQGNSLIFNTGFGLSLTGILGEGSYRENALHQNGGDVNGGFNNGNNVCGAVACPP